MTGPNNASNRRYGQVCANIHQQCQIVIFRQIMCFVMAEQVSFPHQAERAVRVFGFVLRSRKNSVNIYNKAIYLNVFVIFIP